MVGREILARASADGRFDRIFCLVRPPLDRFAALLADQGITNAPHVTALAGDVTEQDLGTALATLADVTHVIHCAATVSFDRSEERRVGKECRCRWSRCVV